MGLETLPDPPPNWSSAGLWFGWLRMTVIIPTFIKRIWYWNYFYHNYHYFWICILLLFFQAFPGLFDIGIQDLDISYHHDFWPFYFYYHLWWVWWILKFILIIIILTLGILWLSLLLWKSVITFSIIINWWLNWDRGKFLFFELCEFLQGIRRGKVVENLLEKPQSQAPNPCP